LINPKCIAFIGSGLVINLPAMFEELDDIEQQGQQDLLETKRCRTRAHALLDLVSAGL
jgi:adenylosuccinate synthase